MDGRSRSLDPQRCPQVMRSLQAFLDAEVDPTDRAGIEAHLDACLACGLEYETYVELKAALRECGRRGGEAVASRLREIARRLVAGHPA